MQNKLFELQFLINELSYDSEMDKIEQYRDRFTKIYSSDFRHDYSEITRILFSIEDQEVRDYLAEKIKNIIEITTDVNTKKSLRKLWDHVNLENIRLTELIKISSETKKAVVEMKKFKDEWDEIKEDVITTVKKIDSTETTIKQMNRDIDNSNAKSITILGIFSGIVMAFTGGLSFIASSLQNMNQVSIYRLVLVVILLSMAIFNIIFMLMYMIGKFTRSYIGGKCNCDDRIEGCNDKTLKCVVVRYPLAIWFNIMSVLAILTVSMLYIVDRFNIITKLLKYNFWGLVIMVAFTFIYFLAIIIGLKKITQIECMYEYVQSPWNTIGGLMASMRSGYRKKSKHCKKADD